MTNSTKRNDPRGAWASGPCGRRSQRGFELSTLVTTGILSLAALAIPAPADPCGMVPPIYLGQGSPITRIGVQQTYVFYKDGVETFVIRPGFSGKVDEFGMLIPFPTPPEIRKVPDNVFSHVAAAVDPPEVVIDFRWQLRAGAANARGGRMSDDALGFQESGVRVIREEAVGMYEVAVLDAGSAAALQRWMDDHGYKYPDGMDAACQDYVDAGWCFVAVKTRVGQKRGVEPRPGMREVDSKLPPGATFDGAVQAMGFRFRVDELVVPMRLSTFNEGELRNVVYVLAHRPMMIRGISEKYVVRQVSGQELYDNLTQPLPLRLIGGDLKDIPDWRSANLDAERDPAPHNGVARELFASDLLAVRTGRLSHQFEEDEKELLRIGERLDLRGPEIDALIQQALAEDRRKVLDGALAELKSMTLTVIDGDFPREVLARDNLRFSPFVISSERNKREKYDARQMGPGGKLEGKRIGLLSPDSPTATDRSPLVVLLWLAAGGAGIAAGFVVHRRTSRRWTTALLLAACMTSGSAALGQVKGDANDSVPELILRLDDPQTAAAAVTALVARGGAAVPHLVGEAAEGPSLARRGWAIACLADIGDEDVDAPLARLQADAQQPALVRTWAAAARVRITRSTDELITLAGHIPEFPALKRPVAMRLVERLAAEGDAGPYARKLLSLVARVPVLQQPLAPAMLKLGRGPLVDAMLHAEDQNARRQAAALLATLGQQGDRGIGGTVVELLQFDAKAPDVPWQGGPLFVPGIAWERDDARALARSLICWHLWCTLRTRTAELQQIHNNLRSLQLAQAAGYKSPGWQEASSLSWLRTWGEAFGADEVRSILDEQGVGGVEPFKALLRELSR